MIRYFLVVFIAFYAPVLAIYFDFIPFVFRFHLLVSIAFALGVYAASRGMTLRQFGFRSDNLRISMCLNALLSLVVCTGILWVHQTDLVRVLDTPDLWSFGFFYVFVSCPAQEFSCRGFLFADMKHAGIRSSFMQIAISSVTYAFLHIIYQDWITLFGTLIIGIAWSTIYLKHPNMWGVIFSHSVIGLISLSAGLI